MTERDRPDRREEPLFQNDVSQIEACERCGKESTAPTVPMAADWGSGAALYTAVCSECVQAHDDYWAQRRGDGWAPQADL